MQLLKTNEILQVELLYLASSVKFFNKFCYLKAVIAKTYAADPTGSFARLKLNRNKIILILKNHKQKIISLIAKCFDWLTSHDEEA